MNNIKIRMKNNKLCKVKDLIWIDSTALEEYNYYEDVEPIRWKEWNI